MPEATPRGRFLKFGHLKMVSFPTRDDGAVGEGPEPALVQTSHVPRLLEVDPEGTRARLQTSPLIGLPSEADAGTGKAAARAA